MIGPQPPRFTPVSSRALVVVVCAGLAAYGCRPPWASGFLLAAVLVLAAGHLGWRAWTRRPWPPSPDLLWALAGALLVWLGALVAYDCWLGPLGGRAPALGRMQLCYAGAFFGAAVVGAAGSAARAQFRRVANVLFLAGGVLALLGLLSYWNITGGFETTHRLSGFTNPNRFAALLTVCWTCGLGALVADWRDLRAGEAVGKFRIAAKTAAAVLVLVCIILTQSRLTLAAIAVVTVLFGWAWVQLHELETHTRLAIPPVSAVERIGLWANRLMPVFGLILVFGICFAIGQNVLRDRSKVLAETGFGERWRVWVAALPMLWEHPWLGQGLGTFESRFTALQPVGLEGRWREAHSDWLQLGIEAGLPALLLALSLAAAWWRSIWRLVKADYQVNRLWALERGLPVAGILAAILCSAADFPLREPATAVMVFFLAGALCQAWPKDLTDSAHPAQPGSLKPAPWPCFERLWPQRAGVLVLALAFLGGTFLAGRNALAYTRSPWLWHLLCPAYTPATADAWRAALTVDPSDPHIRYCLSASLFRTGSPEALTEARANLKIVRAELPDDYKAYGLAAMVEDKDKAGDHEQALALAEEAVRRAPGNRQLRELVGGLYLKGVPRDAIGDQRDAIVNIAIGHFQAVMAVADPSQIISALKAHGCMVNEIGRLWPGNDEASRLRRAEFFLEENQLHLVDMELNMKPPAEHSILSRYHLLLGALYFRRGDDEPAIKEWALALDTAPPELLAQRGNWMASHPPVLDGQLAEKLAMAIESHLPQLPALNGVLMWALVSGRNWSTADRLLAKTAYQSASLYAAWAEAALGMSDLDVAKARAEAAFQRNPRDLANWHREFLLRVKAQLPPR